MNLTGCATGGKSGTGWGRALLNYSGFHQAVCLRRREPLVRSVVFGQIEDREGLAIDYFFRGKALPKWADAGADDQV